MDSAAAGFTGLDPIVILNSVSDGVLVVDRQQRVLGWNAAAHQLLGWTAAELLGKACADTGLNQQDRDGRSLVHPDVGILARCIEAGQATRIPFIAWFTDKDGNAKPLTVSVSPIHNEQGEVIGAVEILRNDRDAVRQMERARSLQRGTMSERLPRNERVEFDVLYRPADLVGGDFYRVQEIAPEVYGIMVADATGHGIPAALYTMLLATLWRDFQALLYAPAGFLCKLNQQLNTLTVESNYCTAVYGVLDLTRGSFIYGCAGHLPPILVDPDHDPVRLHSGGIPLGLFDDTPYGSRRIVLKPDSRLILATDGVTETFNVDGDLFGNERLLDLAKEYRHRPCSELLTAIEDEIIRFSHDVHMADDVTVLTCHVKQVPERGRSND